LNDPHLNWEFFTWGKQNPNYQSHVHMGLTTATPTYRAYIAPHGWTRGFMFRVVISKGSVRKYGVIEVRGAKFDLDKLLQSEYDKGINPQEIADYLHSCSERA
jgi:hypothetical protein